MTTTLTHRQFFVARAMAGAYAHEWPFVVEDEECFFNQGEIAPEAIAAYVEEHSSSYLPGIRSPWLREDGKVVHSTGTGQTNWEIDRSGSVRIEISRPSGIVLRADLCNGALSIVRLTAVPLHERHVWALEKAVRAALDGYGWTRTLADTYETRIRALRTEALPNYTYEFGAGLIERATLDRHAPIRAAWVAGELRSSPWLVLNLSEQDEEWRSEWALVRLHQQGGHEEPLTIEHERGFPSEAAAAIEAKRRNPAVLPWSWLGADQPDVPLAERRAAEAASDYWQQISEADAQALGLRPTWIEWPAEEGRAALARIAWGNEGGRFLIIGAHGGPVVREFADDLAAHVYRALAAKQ